MSVASGDVLSAIAHELRSPIGIVGGVVAHGIDDEELSRLAKRGTQALEHIVRCVEALGTPEDRFESVSLAHAVTAARAELEALEPRRAKRLRWEASPSERTVRGPTHGLSCALVQLLSQVVRLGAGPFTVHVADRIEIHDPEGLLRMPTADSSSSRVRIAAALLAPMTEALVVEADGALLRWVPRSPAG